MPDSKGLIVKAVAGVFELFCEGQYMEAYAAGKFRNMNLTPMVGDKVLLQLSERAGEKNFITQICTRKNALLRPPVANVDTLLITVAVKRPNPDLKLADELICYCRMLDIEPIVCVNKKDYDPQEASFIAQQYQACGIRTCLTSTLEENGAKELKSSIGEGIACFCGQSAVGKSSLTNLLLGRRAFETGGLSRKTERGRHTTRHCELVAFGSNQWLADTPGFSLLEIPRLSPQELLALYEEYAEYASDCRFSGCVHIKEPDCAVKRAVDEGKLPLPRYERYKQIYAEVEQRWRNRYD